MAKTKEDSGPPDIIVGLLQVGEKTTRTFSCPLGNDHQALLQNRPGGLARIVQQSDTEVTIENAGDGPAPFMVLFPTNEMVKLFLAGRQVVDSLRQIADKG